MGLFIVFEGGDGAGKTTQAKALYRRLRQDKHPVIYTEEPGGTTFGRFLRGLVTSPEGELAVTPKEPSPLLLMSPTVGDQAVPDIILGPTGAWAELLYFLLSRAQLVTEVIQPHLSRGSIIICDRYTPSSVAYQGYGRGLEIELVEEANRIATHSLEPNLIVLLDLAPEEGLARKRCAMPDRMEQEDIAFHRRVREGYLKMAKADLQRWLVIDGTLPEAQIRRQIWQRVEQFLV